MRSRQPNLRLDRRNRGLPVLPIVLLVSVVANIFFVLRWEPKQQSEGKLEDAVKAVATAEPGAGAVAGVEGDATPTPTPTPAPAPEPVTPEVGPRFVKVVIDGPVARAFTNKLGSEEGSVLALTAGRLFSWWINPSKDPRKGDVAAVLYEPDPISPNEVMIHGLSYTSQKMGKKFEAFRFQPEGWKAATWFDAYGTEVPAGLEPGVLPFYEQITSLVGDGRGHKGMDFKVEVGTPVFTPFAGKVTRTDWNHRYNGNSVEVRSGARRLRFLHLNHTGVKAGQSVTAGQEIGKSGNTGRSFAPHLHYEIVDGNDRALDPLKVHELKRRTVPEASKEAFAAEMDRLRAKLDQEVAETITPAPAAGAQ